MEEAQKATRRDVLVIGAQFAGLFVARELKGQFNVTVVDAKEYMEFTPGILRAYVKPDHFAAITFLLQPVLTKRLGARFVLGEVKSLDANAANVNLLGGGTETLHYDYCVICSGCHFGPMHKWGESPWSPTVLEGARQDSEWPNLDERYLEGRKQHLLREHMEIARLNESKARVLVAGGGFIGVEWVTELSYFFGDLDLTIIDFLPRCLGPLPEKAAEYCSQYMQQKGIKEHYSVKYMPNDQRFWDRISMPERAARSYNCMGVKACNYFMPKETLSDKGPGGGGWILFNQKLQVTRRPLQGESVGDVWASGRVFAVGDCNYGCVGSAPDWVIPPIPKICYPGEEQAFHACKNVRIMDRQLHRPEGSPEPGDLKDTWWPWGAGIHATSLGVKDGCMVAGTTHSSKGRPKGSVAGQPPGAADAQRRGAGMIVSWGRLAAIEKNFIERTKMSEMQDRCLGKLVWHFVHRMPINLWGSGPCLP